MYGCLAAAVILALAFNMQMHRVVQRYPSQVVGKQLSPSDKWRANLLLQTRLAKFSPQIYIQNRSFGVWVFATCGTSVASLALLSGTLEATIIAPLWPILMVISVLGFTYTRRKLFAAQLVGWKHLLQDEPEQARQWQLDHVDLAQVQARMRALMYGQYLLMAVLILLAASFEFAILTLMW
jgi:hypothetical protein